MIYILAIWFLLWLYKEFPSKSIKAQFKRKLKSGKWGYAQLAFEQFVAQDRREQFRKELDRANESVEAFQTQVDNPKNTPETKKIFAEQVETAKKSVAELKEKLEDADRGLALAEDTKDELHHQEQLLKTFIERNY